MRFALVMAWREARGSRRLLALLALAVALGVAALVAIRSFGDAALTAVRAEARTLLGADLVASSAAAFVPAAEERLERLLREAGPYRSARVASFGGMAVAPTTGATRLVQVMAVEPGYPFYATILTEPAGAWAGLGAARQALVDPSLLAALDLRLGDSVSLGDLGFRIAGVVRRFPGDVGVRSALGPRVYIPYAHAAETRLLGPGARVRHERYLQLDAGVSAPLLLRHRANLAALRVNLRTVDEDQQRLGDGMLRLSRFLSLVGLVALLLGGLGVASAVRVLLERRAATLAILRSLGASARRVTAVYLTQAAILGLAGGCLGVFLGLALARALPRLLRGLLPVEVVATASWRTLAVGVAVGAGGALLFALPSLLRVRHVSPLVALRQDFEAPPRRDRLDVLAAAAPAAGVAGLAVIQAGSPGLGLGFAAGLFVATGTLWLVATLLRRALRRGLSPALPYVWRQGLANLQRPANQTVAVVLALGFGVFLLGTLLVLERGLLSELRTEADPQRPNLALFDIQPDQLETVSRLVAESGRSAVATPIVPMRIASIRGRPTAEALGRLGPDGRPADNAWALRREYRSSYRDRLGPAENLEQGAFWKPGEWATPREGPVPVSLDARLAEDLGVGLGDSIVWDVQGFPIESRVTSLRRVRWARFEPNFFALCPEGPLRDAPQTLVVLTRLSPSERDALERRVVRALPNVSALDLSDVQQSLDAIVSRVAWAIRFMALFSGAVGVLVLLGAVNTSQRQRLREAVLLKALGATRSQVERLVLVEYACLGLLATATGGLLALAAGAALLRFVFETPVVLPWVAMGALAGGVVLLTALLGAAGSRSVFRHTSLELLRAE